MDGVRRDCDRVDGCESVSVESEIEGKNNSNENLCQEVGGNSNNFPRCGSDLCNGDSLASACDGPAKLRVELDKASIFGIDGNAEREKCLLGELSLWDGGGMEDFRKLKGLEAGEARPVIENIITKLEEVIVKVEYATGNPGVSDHDELRVIKLSISLLMKWVIKVAEIADTFGPKLGRVINLLEKGRISISSAIDLW